ncbi:SPOR domain-containing protein [Sodalis glossinidius]|uniref:SPOR domain-containing protein n=1 Tax=Sodalis glossinidius TaxID=63612 RepID=UPI000311B4C1
MTGTQQDATLLTSPSQPPRFPGRVVETQPAEPAVPGRVAASGNLYRVQLGPFQSRQQAQALVQRLQSEAQQSAFIAAQ